MCDVSPQSTVTRLHLPEHMHACSDASRLRVRSGEGDGPAKMPGDQEGSATPPRRGQRGARGRRRAAADQRDGQARAQRLVHVQERKLHRLLDLQRLAPGAVVLQQPQARALLRGAPRRCQPILRVAPRQRHPTRSPLLSPPLY